MLELREAGVGTVILSWWGQESREGTSDTQGVQTDSILPVIIGVVESVPGMTFGLHLEPYSGRSAASVVDDIQYLSAKLVLDDWWLPESEMHFGFIWIFCIISTLTYPDHEIIIFVFIHRCFQEAFKMSILWC